MNTRWFRTVEYMFLTLVRWFFVHRIHCRFGMKGVIAENHFDGSRNSIVVLGGSRRYILSHPNQCEKLALYPKGHPSARHSAVDWSDPDYEQFPDFADALVNEVVLVPGQVLYLPTEWFHYIVSLELNFQCNTRSGITAHYKPDIRRCGF
jgi:ribosomal protein L16 Arg81 hydroxylase